MEEISYPLGNLNSHKQVLKEDWLPEGYNIIRVKTEENNSCLYHAILYDVSEKYRNETNDETLSENVEKFKDQILDYLKYESDYSITEVGKKISSNFDQFIKNHINIIFPKNYNIFGAIFNSKKDNNNKSYPLFSRKTQKFFLPNSKIFMFDKLNNNYITSRYIKIISNEKIENLIIELEKEDTVEEERKELCRLSKEAIENFNSDRENYYQPCKVVEMIKNPSCISDDYIFDILTNVMKINIVILRAWSDNVSVEKIYKYSDISPYILLFMIKPGLVGIHGFYNYGHFESGGIINEKGELSFVLYPDTNEDLIYLLEEYVNSGNNIILNNNYNKYLDFKNRKIEEQEFKDSINKLGKLSDLPDKNSLEDILVDSMNDNKNITDILDSLELK